MGDMGIVAAGALYGAGREWMSDKLAPITSKVPAGQYADEVVMGTIGYFLMKGKIPMLNKIPLSREFGRAALIIESARVGAGVTNGMLTSSSVTATSSGSNW